MNVIITFLNPECLDNVIYDEHFKMYLRNSLDAENYVQNQVILVDSADDEDIERRTQALDCKLTKERKRRKERKKKRKTKKNRKEVEAPVDER